MEGGNQEETKVLLRWLGSLLMNAWGSWEPTGPHELIGISARQIYDEVKATLESIRDKEGRAGTARFLFCGAPGVGKTTLANLLADWWTSNKWNVTTYDGVSVSIDTVVQIEREALGGSLFGRNRALIINECDLVTQGAQNKLLGVLERFPAGYVVFGTSNLKPVSQGVLDLKDASKKKKNEEWLVPRYASRYTQKAVKSPTIQEAAEHVSQLTGVPVEVCKNAAQKSAGDIRQTLTLIGEYESALETIK